MKKKKNYLFYLFILDFDHSFMNSLFLFPYPSFFFFSFLVAIHPMSMFDNSSAPVLNTLAMEFAVFDHVFFFFFSFLFFSFLFFSFLDFFILFYSFSLFSGIVLSQDQQTPTDNLL